MKTRTIIFSEVENDFSEKNIREKINLCDEYGTGTEPGKIYHGFIIPLLQATLQYKFATSSNSIFAELDKLRSADQPNALQQQVKENIAKCKSQLNAMNDGAAAKKELQSAITFCSKCTGIPVDVPSLKPDVGNSL